MYDVLVTWWNCLKLVFDIQENTHDRYFGWGNPAGWQFITEEQLDAAREKVEETETRIKKDLTRDLVCLVQEKKETGEFCEEKFKKL